MKKLILLLSLTFVALNLASCKKDKSGNKADQPKGEAGAGASANPNESSYTITLKGTWTGTHYVYLAHPQGGHLSLNNILSRAESCLRVKESEFPLNLTMYSVPAGTNAPVGGNVLIPGATVEDYSEIKQATNYHINYDGTKFTTTPVAEVNKSPSCYDMTQDAPTPPAPAGTPGANPAVAGGTTAQAPAGTPGANPAGTPTPASAGQ